MQVVDCALQYLKATIGRWPLFKRGESLTMGAYNDADYAGSLSDKTSTSDFYTFLCRNLVARRSKKQNVVEAILHPKPHVVQDLIAYSLLFYDMTHSHLIHNLL